MGGATWQVVLFLRALRSSPAGWPRIGTVGPIDAVADLNHTGRKPLAALPEEQSSWQVWWRKNGVCRGSLSDNNLDLLSNFSGRRGNEEILLMDSPSSRQRGTVQN